MTYISDRVYFLRDFLDSVDFLRYYDVHCSFERLWCAFQIALIFFRYRLFFKRFWRTFQIALFEIHKWHKYFPETYRKIKSEKSPPSLRWNFILLYFVMWNRPLPPLVMWKFLRYSIQIVQQISIFINFWIEKSRKTHPAYPCLIRFGNPRWAGYSGWI